MSDSLLFKYAVNTGKMISMEFISKGDYYPEQAWGSEGQIYPSLMGTALLGLYKKTNNVLFLDGVKAIIESNIQKQMPSGGWALSLGATANGVKFKVSEYIKNLTSGIEDLPPTSAALRLMSDYQALTGDKKYESKLKLGHNFMMSFWNNDDGLFEEMLDEAALKLRAKPKNYQIYSYQYLKSVSNIYPEIKGKLPLLYKTIKKIFQEMDADTYPLLYSLYACLIIQSEKKTEFVTANIKSKIEGELVFNSRFKIENKPGVYGHHDGLRGICLDEGHLRNSIGLAMVLKFYDTYTDDGDYLNSELYSQLESWILSMYFDNRFFEFEDLKTGEKLGVGTPGQFLPIWLALGII